MPDLHAELVTVEKEIDNKNLHNMIEKWNYFVYDLCEAKKKDVDEDSFHTLIETQLLSLRPSCNIWDGQSSRERYVISPTFILATTTA